MQNGHAGEAIEVGLSAVGASSERAPHAPPHGADLRGSRATSWIDPASARHATTLPTHYVCPIRALVRIRFRQVTALRCAEASSRLAGHDHGLPGPVRDRGRLPRLPGGVPLARGLRLSVVRRASRLGARSAPPLGVRRLRAQTSVTAGTVMHGTRTPLRVWFWAAYPVATHHPGISAKQLKRQLGLSRYETAWLILRSSCDGDEPRRLRLPTSPRPRAAEGEVTTTPCWAMTTSTVSAGSGIVSISPRATRRCQPRP